MATIVGFDTDRNERIVFQVAGEIDEPKALRALMMEVILGRESDKPSAEQIEEWNQMSNADLFMTFDDLPHVVLVAVFNEDVEDILD